jgi:hypothetical protein
MMKLGWALTVYICLSFVLFLIRSNTISGAILYFFLLLPFYGVVLVAGWSWVWKNRAKTAKIKHWIWGIVLMLQGATVLTSPGNCFGIKQGSRCYSNLQILLGDVPNTGFSNSPHWTLVEDAFLGFLLAYGVVLVVGLTQIRVVSNLDDTSPDQ